MRPIFDYEKLTLFYKRIDEAAKECGILAICEKMYLVDLKTRATATMQITGAGNEEPEGE